MEKKWNNLQKTNKQQQQQQQTYVVLSGSI